MNKNLIKSYLPAVYIKGFLIILYQLPIGKHTSLEIVHILHKILSYRCIMFQKRMKIKTITQIVISMYLLFYHQSDGVSCIILSNSVHILTRGPSRVGSQTCQATHGCIKILGYCKFIQHLCTFVVIDNQFCGILEIISCKPGLQ